MEQTATRTERRKKSVYRCSLFARDVVIVIVVVVVVVVVGGGGGGGGGGGR